MQAGSLYEVSAMMQITYRLKFPIVLKSQYRMKGEAIFSYSHVCVYPEVPPLRGGSERGRRLHFHNAARRSRLSQYYTLITGT